MAVKYVCDGCTKEMSWCERKLECNNSIDPWHRDLCTKCFEKVVLFIGRIKYESA